MEDFKNHQPNIKFKYTFSKKCAPFLDLYVQLSGGELTTNLHIKPTDRHQYLHSHHPIQILPSAPLHIVKHLD